MSTQSNTQDPVSPSPQQKRLMSPIVRQEALQFFKENHSAVIATVSNDVKPQASTIYYVGDNDFGMYFITTRDTQKYRNLKDNKKISVVIGTGPKVITLQGGGTAEEILDPDQKAGVIVELSHNIHLRGSRFWPILELHDSDAAIFKATFDWMTWLNLDLDSHLETFQDGYYRIIP